ncbi:hypothetical protein [Fulvivirga ligni]|uniref:hypothetical protein n=1 Tax=Fulvivirga ligni TaxID=2904246 RepID=UPI001F169AA8|nr:hypothetical protein [Fulvivirga ligni]UII23576.1 hypothetical protein LVD16_10090 [Fulvivirga ligni]
MKKMLILFVGMLFITSAYAQLKEGQSFCDENEDGSYFPLIFKERKIFWVNTYYTETKIGTKELNGRTYFEYAQTWENGAVDTLYLREDEGVIYQYAACCEEETIRYDSKFEKGHQWKNMNGGKYKIITYDGTLKTRLCEYKNLMVMEADMGDVIFQFYYLRGHGYVGATVDDTVISFATPTFDLD